MASSSQLTADDALQPPKPLTFDDVTQTLDNLINESKKEIKDVLERIIIQVNIHELNCGLLSEKPKHPLDILSSNLQLKVIVELIKALIKGKIIQEQGDNGMTIRVFSHESGNLIGLSTKSNISFKEDLGEFDLNPDYNSIIDWLKCLCLKSLQNKTIIFSLADVLDGLRSSLSQTILLTKDTALSRDVDVTRGSSSADGGSGGGISLGSAGGSGGGKGMGSVAARGGMGGGKGMDASAARGGSGGGKGMDASGVGGGKGMDASGVGGGKGMGASGVGGRGGRGGSGGGKGMDASGVGGGKGMDASGMGGGKGMGASGVGGGSGGGKGMDASGVGGRGGRGGSSLGSAGGVVGAPEEDRPTPPSIPPPNAGGRGRKKRKRSKSRRRTSRKSGRRSQMGGKRKRFVRK